MCKIIIPNNIPYLIQELIKNTSDLVKKHTYLNK